MNKVCKGLLISLGITAICLSGCRNKKNEKRGYVLFNVWGSAEEVSYYEEIAENFMEETGIKVTVKPSTSSYYNELNIALSSPSTAPDIFWTESGQFTAQLATGKLLNLSPYLEDGTIDIQTENNPEGKLVLWDNNSIYQYDGEKYGEGDYYALIKDWTADFVLWYNKSIIDDYNDMYGYEEDDDEYIYMPKKGEAPLSWAQFLDYSYRLNNYSNKKTGVTVTSGTMLDRVPYKHVFEWIQMTGSSVWDESGKYLNWEDKNVQKAFQFFVDLQVGDKKSSPLCTVNSAIESGDAFASKKIPFCFFGNWAYTSYNWADYFNTDVDNPEIGYTYPPVPDANPDETDIKASCASAVGLAVYNKSTMKTEAVKFLNYYMTEGQKILADKGFNVPGNKLVAENEFQSSSDEFTSQLNEFFFDLADNYTETITYNEYVPQETVEEKMGKYFTTYLNDPSSSTLVDVLFNIYNELRLEV